MSAPLSEFHSWLLSVLSFCLSKIRTIIKVIHNSIAYFIENNITFAIFE